MNYLKLLNLTCLFYSSCIRFQFRFQIPNTNIFLWVHNAILPILRYFLQKCCPVQNIQNDKWKWKEKTWKFIDIECRFASIAKCIILWWYWRSMINGFSLKTREIGKILNFVLHRKVEINTFSDLSEITFFF